MADLQISTFSAVGRTVVARFLREAALTKVAYIRAYPLKSHQVTAETYLSSPAF